jgi:hypothetical protein
MSAQLLDEVRTAHDDARLRPAQQLVAGEANDVRTAGKARARRRLVADLDQCA